MSRLLGVEPVEFMRKNEPEYKQYVKGRTLNVKQQAEMIAEMPILLERPIVVKDDEQAVVGRPPEDVKQLF